MAGVKARPGRKAAARPARSRAKTKKAAGAAAVDTLYEVFVRSAKGVSHRHVGSIHASDPEMALQNARDAFTRRMEGVSIWVVSSAAISASEPADRESLFDPAKGKIYRHPTFYELPDDIEYV